MRHASTLLAAPPLPAGLPDHPPDQPAATCALSPRPESVKAGRDFAGATLRDWGMASLTGVAELVVSELVTNALRHGISSAGTESAGSTGSARSTGSAGSTGSAASAGQSVRLRLLAQAPFVMCMVTDPGSGIPVLRHSDTAAETGRGLRVIEACSVRWGWHLLDGGGKVVWALLR